jgi:hypothetical protein
MLRVRRRRSVCAVNCGNGGALIRSTRMRAPKIPTAIAVTAILTAGLLYSTVCDTSCALLGCASIFRLNPSQSEDPHAHCHAKKNQGQHARSANQSIPFSGDPERGKQGQFPECEIHAFSSTLLPRVAGESLAALQLLNLDLARPVDFKSWALSEKPLCVQVTAPFRSPPSLASLRALRI